MTNDSPKKRTYRGWVYAELGDYHRDLPPNWSYTPTYLKKMQVVRHFLDTLPSEARILDAGCGEGVLVEEYKHKGRAIEGLDLNYASEHVRWGDILRMPYEDARFNAVLLLDVFEHLAFADQPRALQETGRVLQPKGQLLLSTPNLAHLNSRVKFFFKGQLHRTDREENHVGERPMAENIHLIQQNGFLILRRIGITLTLPPVYTRLISRWPERLLWLHNFLDFFALPGLAMLNMFWCEKRDRLDSC